MLPVAESTSSELLVRKFAPFTAWAANATTTKIDTRMIVESTPASPGVLLGLSLSSLTLVAVSQPQ